MVSFTIEKRGEVRYYAALLTVNEIIVLRGIECKDLMECIYSIYSIRTHAPDFSKYDLMYSLHGHCFFELTGSDGKIIARSILYENETEVCIGIEFVRRTIQLARIEDFTHLISCYPLYKSN
jgi:uncharacterized protein YegP (UPF0339 family)